MFKSLRDLLDKYGAWRRDEVRVGDAVRGRIYKKEQVAPSGNVKSVTATKTPRLVPSRVYSEKEKRWYTIDEWRKKNG